MSAAVIPDPVENLIGGTFQAARSGETFEKLSPHDGALLCRAARSGEDDINVAAARAVQPDRAILPGVQRGTALAALCDRLESARPEIASIVAQETGKSPGEAAGEVGGAIALGRFFAGEGQRLYGRITTSGGANRYAMTVRQPCGFAGLIIAANTPIANVAWKVFPALICGNGVVLKSAGDTPATVWAFARAVRDAGLPEGTLNAVHGYGEECGAPLVRHPDVDVISFTGLARVRRWIAETAGPQFKKASLDFGGKNPLVVCDDADLDYAVKWDCLSAFSNVGQRCASGSRVIVFDAVYDAFCDKFVAATRTLKVGPDDGDDLGPVINARRLDNMVNAVTTSGNAGATILAGGNRLDDDAHAKGCYMAPTVIENVAVGDDISNRKLFGPITCLYRVKNFAEALACANDSPYGLTAVIHTRSFDRAIEFTNKVRSGVVTVNGGTYGSEPHMPFGGLRQSSNGSREPGTEALDIYSELKDVYFVTCPDAF